ncbi:MAG: DeoR/GlpR transcriptional regulator [archaeon]|nr:DeoR/GlpR transcriptional regulator [archaeon]
MLALERQNRIIDTIKEKGQVTIEELAKEYNISKMTALRDLNKIAENNAKFIEKVHGGAVLKKPVELNQELNFEEKITKFLYQKQAIAKFAAENFVNNSDILFLSGGSTVMEMLPYLKQKNLTLVTNGIKTAALSIEKVSNLKEVYCSGGLIRPQSYTVINTDAEEFFSKMNATTVFLSAMGVSIEKGITDPDMHETSIKRTMHKNANKTIVLMDSSKIEKYSL